jgi:glycerate 2-kinase
MSACKGGQLAAAACPTQVVSFVLSDVIGDPLDSIASGPTVPDVSTFADALAVLERAPSGVPDNVMQRVKAGALSYMF